MERSVNGIRPALLIVGPTEYSRWQEVLEKEEQDNRRPHGKRIKKEKQGRDYGGTEASGGTDFE